MVASLRAEDGVDLVDEEGGRVLRAHADGPVHRRRAGVGRHQGPVGQGLDEVEQPGLAAPLLGGADDQAGGAVPGGQGVGGGDPRTTAVVLGAGQDHVAGQGVGHLGEQLRAVEHGRGGVEVGCRGERPGGAGVAVVGLGTGAPRCRSGAGRSGVAAVECSGRFMRRGPVAVRCGPGEAGPDSGLLGGGEGAGADVAGGASSSTRRRLPHRGCRCRRAGPGRGGDEQCVVAAAGGGGGHAPGLPGHGGRDVPARRPHRARGRLWRCAVLGGG